MCKKNYLLVFFLVMFFMVATQADTIELNPDRPEKYVVQKGDTLWDISGRFLKEPWQWKKIWEGNPQIENPHLIYPGDTVTLVFKHGEPVLIVNGEGDGQPTADVVEDRTVKLSPKIRISEHETVTKKIHFDFIKSFSRLAVVITKDEMEYLPYVVSSVNAGQSLIAWQDEKLYVRGLNAGGRKAKYSIFRAGDVAYTNPLKDPDDVLGYEARYIGDVAVEEYGDPTSVQILSAEQGIRRGDRLVPTIRESVGEIILTAPESAIDGNIISILEGFLTVGEYQTVVVDVGSNQNIKFGDVLGVYKNSIVEDETAAQQHKKRREERRIIVEHEDKNRFNQELSQMINGLRDIKTEFKNSKFVQYLGQRPEEKVFVKLPSEYVGALVIFRVFPKVSYGLVLNIEGSIKLLDSVKNL